MQPLSKEMSKSRNEGGLMAKLTPGFFKQKEHAGKDTCQADRIGQLPSFPDSWSSGANLNEISQAGEGAAESMEVTQTVISSLLTNDLHLSTHPLNPQLNPQSSVGLSMYTCHTLLQRKHHPGRQLKLYLSILRQRVALKCYIEVVMYVKWVTPTFVNSYYSLMKKNRC